MSTKGTAATITRTGQGVDLGTGSPRHGFHPARDEASCGCRARHRPHQGRAPYDRNFLKGRVGDRINAVLAAAGYNFGLLLRWLAELLRAIIRAFAETVPAQKIA